MIASMRRYLESIHWLCDEAALRQELCGQHLNFDFGFSGVQSTPPKQRHFPKQVHGTVIIEAKSSLTDLTSPDRPQADGIFTTVPATTVAVQTADCLPVLIYHSRCAMAVHAGWRGLAAGILQQASKKLEDLSIQPEETCVILGPAIGPASYEVGPELVDQFQGMFADSQALAWVMGKGQADRWHLDLAMAASLSLAELGFPAASIYCLRSCTKMDEDHWHSYRRQAEEAGRNWSWLSLRAGNLAEPSQQ